MFDPRHALFVGALVASALAAAAPARADMVQTVDGKWWPETKGEDGKTVVYGPDETPSDEALQASADFKVDASYDVVTAKRQSFSRPAGQVRRLLATDTLTEAFRGAMNEADSGFFESAAEKFLDASGELQGLGKQIALWYRVQALANGPASAAEKALAAGDALIAAFPKSYWFADARIMRARYAATRNVETASDDAAKVLATIVAAKDMNARDLFRAERNRILLTLENARKLDAAEKAYRELVAKIEKSDPVQGATVRQEALVGIGNALFAAKKEAEAKGFFEKASESSSSDVLAGAYLGLGNVAYAEAKVLQDEKKAVEARERLLDAVTHYLRVTLKYREIDDAGIVVSALINQAKIFSTLFELSPTATKDCESADRAWRAYRELVDRPEISSQRSALIREFKALDEKKKAACSVPTPPAKPAK